MTNMSVLGTIFPYSTTANMTAIICLGFYGVYIMTSANPIRPWSINTNDGKLKIFVKYPSGDIEVTSKHKSFKV